MYSAGLPFGNLIGFLYFVIFYWSDKWYFFVKCRKPAQILDSSLQNLATVILLFVPVTHCLVAMLAFGVDQIFY